MSSPSSGSTRRPRIVHHQFRKFIWGEAYQHILTEGLDLLMVREEGGFTKYLSENRVRIRRTARGDTEWVMNHW